MTTCPCCAVLGAALLVLFAILMAFGWAVFDHHHRPLRRIRRAVAHSFSIISSATEPTMPIVGTPFKLALGNVKDGADQLIDLSQFPAALTSVSWAVDNPDVAAVNPTTPDGFHADLTFAQAGVAVVTVTAVNAAGETLTVQRSLEGSVPVPVAKSFEIVDDAPAAPAAPAA